jgi:3',5'-cyclic AMP phosphodiesterase CpdA
VKPSILHISDIHPRPGDDLEQLASGIAHAANPFNIGFLVVSGDLGYQGKNHDSAGEWLRRLAQLIHVPIDRVVCVPGNHDIDTHRPHDPFGEYSRGLFRLYANSERTVVRTADLYKSGDAEFLTINSAYHLDTAYGMVDYDAIRRVLLEPSRSATRIAVVHHNPIPVSDADRSTIVNAYGFLKLISETGFEVLLHGHQHLAMSLRVGTSTRLVGVGSVNFPPWKNTNNQFNVLEVGKRIIRFRLHADSVSPSHMGNWDGHEEQW